MTTRTHVIGAAAALLVALSPARVVAQGPPPRVAPRAPATTAPASTASATPAPLLVPATAPTPPAPQKVVTPASALPPSDNAVALCMNGTFVNKPGTPADCAGRGGLRVAFTSHLRTPPPAPGTPAAAAAAAQRLSNVRAVSASMAPPVGATARCKDATYITGTPSPTMCDAHGGVAVTFPAARRTPAAPARRP
ncbi:MAG: hypothetical protein ACREN6_09475 [Gemmatimonadaceae bacterium]